MGASRGSGGRGLCARFPEPSVICPAHGRGPPSKHSPGPGALGKGPPRDLLTDHPCRQSQLCSLRPCAGPEKVLELPFLWSRISPGALAEIITLTIQLTSFTLTAT